jgi:alpha-L-rhamnosidase
MACLKTALLFLCAAAPAFAAASVQAVQLRCEYRNNPQGIDVPEPRLSWQLSASDAKLRGLRQSAYRIVVSSSLAQLRASAFDLWDTGKVDSAQAIQLAYHGKALASGAQAAWKVQVWDQDGKPAAWSDAAQWTMGLLRPEDWRGKWIGRDERADYANPESSYHMLDGARWIWDAAVPPTGAPPSPQTPAPAVERFFRETVSIPAGRKISRATLIAGGDNNTDVYLNGEPVATRTAAAMPPILDVGALLHPGDNLLAIRGTQTRPDRPAGVIAVLRVEFTSGDPLIFQTGNRWRASAKVEEGWQKAGYLDSAWRPAVELGSYGMPPWGAVGLTAEHRLPARMLRKEFTVDKKIRRATVYFSGLGLSELYINGAKIGDHVLSPGLTDYDKHTLYVTYELPGLNAGRNVIGLILGNGRYYAPRLQPGTRNFGFPKAIVQLNLEYEDGSRQSVVSDESWKLTTNGPIRANNEYDGEVYDARREMPGWSRAGFDDSSW